MWHDLKKDVSVKKALGCNVSTVSALILKSVFNSWKAQRATLIPSGS
jgi:hypothetical protein